MYESCIEISLTKLTIEANRTFFLEKNFEMCLRGLFGNLSVWGVFRKFCFSPL